MNCEASHRVTDSEPRFLLDWASQYRRNARKALVIGLDSAAPDLVFRRFAGDLPNLHRLMQGSIWGPLESVIPAITIPAWASAMTGCDPGELGIYGFRRRFQHDFGPARMVDSTDLRRDAVWDVLSRNGDSVIVVGVPPAYPPRRVRGCMVSCFLTPNLRRPATYPKTLQSTIARVAAGYTADVEGYRSDDRARLLQDIRSMTCERFRLFRHLLRTEPWTFAMMVEIGLDRAHHAFWGAFDEEHPRYVRGGPFEFALRDYYRVLDDEIGATLAETDDSTAIFIFSDHGVKRIKGGICLNEWLVCEGYLSLKIQPKAGEVLQPGMIDFENTVAWAEGGHAGRIQLNVKGRQATGIVDPDARENLLAQIERGILAITDARGKALDHRVFRPELIYRTCNEYPPDLIVYLGDLDYRSIGTMGHNAIHVAENDAGPDSANHDSAGLIVASIPGAQGGSRANLRLIDCGPAILECLGSRFAAAQR